MQKEIAIIGLGKMGGNIARRLANKDWKVVGYNRTTSVTEALAQEGIIPALSFEELTKKLTSTPKVVLLVLPSGQPTDDILFGENNILSHLSPGDIVIDGANSFYKDTVRRHEKIKDMGIKFIDAGISGGPGGALNGACLMVGGEKEIFTHLEPLFNDMAKEEVVDPTRLSTRRVADPEKLQTRRVADPEKLQTRRVADPEKLQVRRAVMHFDGVGAGHFVKMVHNGIEYGMMQSIAEGFTIMHDSPFNLDLLKVTDIYNNGSVVEGRLVGWLAQAFEKYGQDLKDVSGAVGFNGEGEWTAKVGEEMKIPTPAIKDSVEFRKQSQTSPSYTGKVLTGMRNSFGGHSIEKGKMT